MAALQPTVGGLPVPNLHRSFADVLVSHPLLLQKVPMHPDNLESHANPNSFKPLSGLQKGFPSIAFTDPELSDLSKPFGWSLIGKFSQGYNKHNPKLGRPSVNDIEKYLIAMNFKGGFNLGLMDNRHLWIHFRQEADYLRMYSRQIWYIGGIAMRIFKWSPFFQVDRETSIVPVWITFPRLPIQFFQQAALFPIAGLIGNPLRMDAATCTLKRPSVARIQVDLDLLKEHPTKVWIQMGSRDGYWQKVEYENKPSYCTYCWHVGHSPTHCHVHNPALKASPKDTSADTLQWVPKKPSQQISDKNVDIGTSSEPCSKATNAANSPKPQQTFEDNSNRVESLLPVHHVSSSTAVPITVQPELLAQPELAIPLHDPGPSSQPPITHVETVVATPSANENAQLITSIPLVSEVAFPHSVLPLIPEPLEEDSLPLALLVIHVLMMTK